MKHNSDARLVALDIVHAIYQLIHIPRSPDADDIYDEIESRLANDLIKLASVVANSSAYTPNRINMKNG